LTFNLVLPFFACSVLSYGLLAQETMLSVSTTSVLAPKLSAEQITDTNVMTTISFLASDELAGRAKIRFLA
jgi:hypothetical protein